MTKLLRHAKGQNFGDASNEWLFKNFCPDIQSEDCWWSINKEYNCKTILGMGSIIDKINTNDVVCGSGMIAPNLYPKFPPNKLKEMRLIRGPLTYDKLVSKGYKVQREYGDPGLLFSEVYKPEVIKKHKFGVIPHFSEKDKPGVKKLISQGCHYIDIEQANTPEKFLNELNECNVIFSSSLHGIIIADSYDIPAYHAKFGKGINDFKFRDYYASVERNYSFVPIYDSNINTNILEKHINNYSISFDKNKLVDNIKKICN